MSEQLGDIPVVDPLVAVVMVAFQVFPWWGIALAVLWLLIFAWACMRERTDD